MTGLRVDCFGTLFFAMTGLILLLPQSIGRRLKAPKYPRGVKTAGESTATAHHSIHCVNADSEAQLKGEQKPPSD